MNNFTHFDTSGRAVMVDISNKADTKRVAIAQGLIKVKPETLLKIKNGELSKGDVLAVAQVAGITAAKKTPDIIPMCHNILLTGIKITFSLNFEKNCVEISAEVSSTGGTGVEMEALTAVSAAALTIYDMCKSADKTMIIERIFLKEKNGGKSGHFISDITLHGE